MNIFKTWLEINLNPKLKTSDDFSAEGCRMSEKSKRLIDYRYFRIAPIENVSLVKVSAEDLGFRGLATRFDIQSAGMRQGLFLCPPNLGPNLRIQIAHKQPLNERLHIAMESYMVEGELLAFHVSCGEFHGSLFDELHAYRGDPKALWDARELWVFAQDSKK